MADTAVAAAEAFTVVLPKEYPLVLLGCVILCIECFMMGMIVGKARFRIFTKDFMEQFKEEH